MYRDKAEFRVLPSNARTAPLNVVVDGPTSPIPADIIEGDGGGYEVSFVPTEVGEHNVDVRFGDTPVPGSPFTVMVGDPKRVVIPATGEDCFENSHRNLSTGCLSATKLLIKII